MGVSLIRSRNRVCAVAIFLVALVASIWLGGFCGPETVVVVDEVGRAVVTARPAAVVGVAASRAAALDAVTEVHAETRRARRKIFSIPTLASAASAPPREKFFFREITAMEAGFQP